MHTIASRVAAWKVWRAWAHARLSRALTQCHLKKRGLTLIELLIVVAIIAILVGVLIPNFLRARAQSQLAASKGNMKHLAAALELYRTENALYPIATGFASEPPGPPGVVYAHHKPRHTRGGHIPGGGGFVSGDGGGGGGTGIGVLLVLVPKYLQVVPFDPCTGFDYYYTSTDGSTYSLSIDFPSDNRCDALVGTEGDTVDLTYTPSGGLREGP